MQMQESPTIETQRKARTIAEIEVANLTLLEMKRYISCNLLGKPFRVVEDNGSEALAGYFYLNRGLELRIILKKMTSNYDKQVAKLLSFFNEEI